METLFLSFVKLFVATDALGTLPIYISLTEGMDKRQKVRAIRLSIITSLAVVVGFVVIGKWLLDVLGVSVYDFRIAGGLLLLVLSIDVMMHDEEAKTRGVGDMVGVVPLGTPLIAGPCVLTMVMVLAGSVGRGLTLVAAVANILIAGVVFMNADIVTRIVGQTGSRAFSKVSSLLLAGIAVTMMRRGIVEAIEQARAAWQ